MASQNALIVEVVGDTRKLTRALNDAKGQLSKFSARTSTIRTTGLDDLLTRNRNAQAETAKLEKQLASLDTQAAATAGSLRSAGLAAAGIGIAAFVAGKNLSQLDGQLGRVGDSVTALTSGDFVGFWRDVRRETATSVEELTKVGDVTKLIEVRNKAAAAGFKTLAENADKAAKALQAAANSFVDVTKIRDSTSPGALAHEFSTVPLPDTTATRRRGITQSQRNTFFDNQIRRSLDRVRDLGLGAQVAELRRIEAKLKARQATQTDPTRKLNLGDQINAIEREIRGVNEQIQSNLQDAAKRLKDAREKLAADQKEFAANVKSSVLDLLGRKQDRVDNARELADSQATLREALRFGGPEGIKLARRDVDDARRAIERQRVEDTAFRFSGKNTLAVGTVTIHVNGTGDPEKVAKLVAAQLQKLNRRGATQQRGTVAGRNVNVGIN